MADEKKLNGMEEYSIPEEGSTGEYNEQSATISGSIKQSGRGKKLLIPLILVVAIVVFYQILSWYSHRTEQKGLKEEQEVARKTQQSMVVQPPRVAEPVVVATTPTEISVPSTSTASDRDVQNKLEILANRTESNSQQLERLQNDVSRSNATLIGLDQTMTDLSSSVQGLTKQVQQLSASKSKPKKIKRVVKPMPPKVIYHVKAIVPDRAWLESSAGATVSVRVGDKLNGYGVVQLISPQQGVVITSSGSAIQYGVNDF